MQQIGPRQIGPRQIGLRQIGPLADWAHLDKVLDFGVKPNLVFNFLYADLTNPDIFVYYSWTQHGWTDFACRLRTLEVAVRTAQCIVLDIWVNFSRTGKMVKMWHFSIFFSSAVTERFDFFNFFNCSE